MSDRERPLKQIPFALWLLLAVALVLQLDWHSRLPTPSARAQNLPQPPTLALLRLFGLGDDVALAKVLNLWLQAYDNQPGISVPFRQLDYSRVRGWLQLSLDLDPRGHYPLLAAVRLYGQVPSAEKKRQMLDFAYQKFLERPNERWPWLAHAVVVARHELKDQQLALKYAQALAVKTTGSQVPHWAQQMSIFVLADMGQTEAARILLGGLLESGQITDPHELRFLSEQLDLLGDADPAARDEATKFGDRS